MADLIAIAVADVIAIMVWWILLLLLILCNISITLADVIANFYCGRFYCHIFVVEVVTTFVVISLYCKVADAITIICGRWKTTKCLYVMLADVIATVVDGITTQGGFYLADVIAMVADGIITGQLHFNFSSEMFNRTSCNMCGRWNLPTFLIMDGLLALI